MGPDSRNHYELCIEGHLGEHWAVWFGGMVLRHQDDGTTTLCGFLADQAALHGVLAKVRDLGAVLVSVVRLKPPAAPATHRTQVAAERRDSDSKSRRRARARP